MGESQSRDSIVERLTQTKPDIMTAKSQLKEELLHKEQKTDESKFDLDNWNKDIMERVSRIRRGKEREIEKAKQEFKNLSDRIIEKEKVYNDKIKAIEEALRSIEEISKTSTNIQS